MGVYMVTRTLPPLTEEELNAVGRSVIATCREIGDMRWIHSHLTADGRHSFCVFEAPNATACREHARRAGLPLDDVLELGPDLGPHLFK